MLPFTNLGNCRLTSKTKYTNMHHDSVGSVHNLFSIFKSNFFKSNRATIGQPSGERVSGGAVRKYRGMDRGDLSPLGVGDPGGGAAVSWTRPVPEKKKAQNQIARHFQPYLEVKNHPKYRFWQFLTPSQKIGALCRKKFG